MLSEEQKKAILDRMNQKEEQPVSNSVDLRTRLDELRSKRDSAKQTVNQLPPEQEELDNLPEEPGMLEKASNITEKVLGPPSRLLYGSFGKSAGTLFTSGLASGAELAGKETIFGADVEKLKEQEEDITAGDIAFTTLELLPGGGLLGKALKKLPGGKFIAEGISNTIGKLTGKQKEKAIKMFTEALAPTTKKTKSQAGKIVPGLLEKEVKGSLPKIEKIAQQQISEQGSKINEIIKNLPEGSKIKVKPVVDSISEWQSKFVVDGKAINPKAVKLGDDLKEIFVQFGDEVDTESMRKVRQILDKEVALGSGFTADVITKLDTQVKKEITDSIRNEIAKEVPELAKVNKEYTFWKNVDDVVGGTIERTKGQSGRLREGIGTLTGGAAGISGGLQTAVAGAVIGKIVTKVVNSAAWKTLSAIQRNKIADYVAEGNKEKLFNYLRRTSVITRNEYQKYKQDSE